MSPVVATVLLLGLVALLGVSVVVALGGIGTAPDPIAVSIVVTAESADDHGGRLTIRHEGGDPVALDEVDLRILVDGEPLRYQPDVPFTGNRGFQGSPTGVFNARTGSTWAVGRSGGLTIANNNAPTIDTGSEVVVEVRHGDRVVARASTIAL